MLETQFPRFGNQSAICAPSCRNGLRAAGPTSTHPFSAKKSHSVCLQPAGDTYCLDMVPAPGGVQGQIVRISWEERTIEVLAWSFVEFLHLAIGKLRQELESQCQQLARSHSTIREVAMNPASLRKQLENLLRDSNGTRDSEEGPRLEGRSVDFVFIEVNCPDLASAAQSIQRAIDSLAADQEIFIDEILSTFVFAYYGIPRPVPDGPEKRKRCAQRLSGEFGTLIRIVHGTADAAVGAFGGTSRLHYGAISLQTAEHLKALIGCEYGQVLELT